MSLEPALHRADAIVGAEMCDSRGGRGRLEDDETRRNVPLKTWRPRRSIRDLRRPTSRGDWRARVGNL